MFCSKKFSWNEQASIGTLSECSSERIFPFLFFEKKQTLPSTLLMFIDSLSGLLLIGELSGVNNTSHCVQQKQNAPAQSENKNETETLIYIWNICACFLSGQ